MADNILPCPFCGNSEFETIRGVKMFFVACEKCKAFGPSGYTVAEAIEKWNARAPQEKLTCATCATCVHFDNLWPEDNAGACALLPTIPRRANFYCADHEHLKVES